MGIRRRIRGDLFGQTGFGTAPAWSSSDPLGRPSGTARQGRAWVKAWVKDNILNRCEEAGCGGLLRPHVVWFGENLDPAILELVDRELALCDLCLVVGHTLLRSWGLSETPGLGWSLLLFPLSFSLTPSLKICFEGSCGVL